MSPLKIVYRVTILFGPAAGALGGALLKNPLANPLAT